MNDSDIVCKLPLSLNALVYKVEYKHCGDLLRVGSESASDSESMDDAAEIIRSVASGEAMYNHFEDKYYEALRNLK